MANNQDNLNSPLCLHLNASSLCSLSSSLRSLKLIILIFSSIHKLHLPLKLLTVEDCLFPILFEGLASDHKVPKIFRLNGLISKSRIGECLWLYSPCF